MTTSKNNILVVGASPDPNRFSYLCTKRLLDKGYPVIPLGKRSGQIAGLDIVVDQNGVNDVDTVTMYLSLWNQADMVDFIMDLNPRRIIFNPGAENPSLKSKAEKAGVETVDACTLVMLSAGTF
mgnify:CR=1 FL=1